MSLFKRNVGLIVCGLVCLMLFSQAVSASESDYSEDQSSHGFCGKTMTAAWEIMHKRQKGESAFNMYKNSYEFGSQGARLRGIVDRAFKVPLSEPYNAEEFANHEFIICIESHRRK